MLLSQDPKVIVFEQILNNLSGSEGNNKAQQQAWQALHLYENMPNEKLVNAVYAKYLLQSIKDKIYSLVKNPVYVDSSANLLYLSVDHKVINSLADFQQVICAQIKAGNIELQLSA